MKRLVFIFCLSLIGCAREADKLPDETPTLILPSGPGKKGEILNWQCDHQWVKSKYWITTMGSNKEPQFYPPSALMPVKVCKKCGTLRINPKELGK